MRVHDRNMCIRVYVRMCDSIFGCAWVCACMLTHVHVWACMCMYGMCAGIIVCLCVWLCTCLNMYVNPPCCVCLYLGTRPSSGSHICLDQNNNSHSSRCSAPSPSTSSHPFPSFSSSSPPHMWAHLCHSSGSAETRKWEKCLALVRSGGRCYSRLQSG